MEDDATLLMSSVAELRQAVFKLAAEIFLPPAAGRLGALAQASSRLRESSAWASGFAFFPGVDRFLVAVAGLVPSDGPAIEKGFGTLFGVSSQRTAVPLHETAFLDQTGESSGPLLASIEQHYASAGMAVPRMSAALPDHISTELEFLSILCGREAAAWEAGDTRGVRRVQDRQRRFMEKHPSNWLPAFCRALKERDGGIFWQAAEAARSLIVHDLDFLQALRPHLREPSDAPPGET